MGKAGRLDIVVNPCARERIGKWTRISQHFLAFPPVGKFTAKGAAFFTDLARGIFTFRTPLLGGQTFANAGSRARNSSCLQTAPRIKRGHCRSGPYSVGPINRAVQAVRLKGGLVCSFFFRKNVEL